VGIAGAMALPLLVTLWRGATAGGELWGTLWQARLIPLLANTLALAGAVTPWGALLRSAPGLAD
jgi:ABC-type Fe3+ transport system permease subunit